MLSSRTMPVGLLGEPHDVSDVIHEVSQDALELLVTELGALLAFSAAADCLHLVQSVMELSGSQLSGLLRSTGEAVSVTAATGPSS